MYNRWLAPRLVHHACSGSEFRELRQKTAGKAQGEVVEIGIGSGLNLPFYDASKVKRLIGIEPNPRMRELGDFRTRLNFELLESRAESMPLPDQSADCVVVTYTLCSIQKVQASLVEVGRILRPGGKLHFCEHGRAKSKLSRGLQNICRGWWPLIAMGCHLDREPDKLISDSLFRIESLDCFVLGKMPAFLGTQYLGSATLDTK